MVSWCSKGSMSDCLLMPRWELRTVTQHKGAQVKITHNTQAHHTATHARTTLLLRGLEAVQNRFVEVNQ
ncbi:hypothetical protein E2C01_080940 [Portunus trituberculatus]|uniref:Uncharacterized protein n=1 Tax=Portunus trituberculatus TaxID=210409 RepID=A0A5B7J0X8_PORTR|nr:hypothetical protein [Portunus trituberculatus]